MKRIDMLRYFVITTFTMLALCACSPVINRPGKMVSQSKIEGSQFVTGDGAALPMRIWSPPKEVPVKAVVVAVHGFNDYSNFFELPGRSLSRGGVACYAYDQRGFGRAPGRGLWAGEEAYLDDLRCFVKEIRKLHPGAPLYLLGESMGGAVVINALTGANPPDADGVILVAPAVWGRETMPWYQRLLLAVASHTLPWLTLTGEGTGVVATDNVPLLRAFSRDPLVISGTRVDAIYGLCNLMDQALERAAKLRVPTLVLYGQKDQIIPKSPVLRMLDTMPRTTRRAFFENGYHMLLRDLEREKPTAAIATWIAGHNNPLPYGVERWAEPSRL